MAGNSRGKLKEHLEGIHRNYEWIKEHITKAVTIIGDKNPAMVEALEAMAEVVCDLDAMANDIYAKL